MKWIARGLILFWVSPLHAAYVVSTVLISDQVVQNPASGNVTVGTSLVDPMIFIFAGAFDNVTPGNSVVTGVTCGGVAATLIVNMKPGQGTTSHTLSAWGLINPPRGTISCVTTYAGTPLGGDVVMAAVLSNVSQSTTSDSFSTINNANSPFPVSVQRTYSGDLVFSLISSDNNALTGQNADQTTFQRMTSNFWWGSYSTEDKTKGLKVHSYTGGAADTVREIIVSIPSDTPYHSLLRGGLITAGVNP